MRVLSALLAVLALLAWAVPAQADDGRELLLRTSAQPSQLSDPVVFGVTPGRAPWNIESSRVRLRADGRLRVEVQGLVIPVGRANGTNPVGRLSASVFCSGEFVAQTASVRFSRAGDAFLRTRIAALPATCALPTVLLHPLEDRTRYIARAGGGAAQATTLTGGLDNPRHLVLGPDGLLVAEAGRGGDGPCLTGPEGPACIGATGAVSRVTLDGRRERLVTGLPSFSGPGGVAASGPHGIDAVRRGAFVSVGGPTSLRDGDGPVLTRAELAARAPVADGFGRVLRVRADGRVQRVADPYAVEQELNPDGEVGEPTTDSNAYGLVADGARRQWVVDAGGNRLDAIEGGRERPLAVFPSRLVPGPGGQQIPMQAVPTSVAQGPDGALYVGQLTGFPFPLGGSQVVRVDPDTGATSIAATGFTNVVDLTFDHDGNLLVLELDADSLLAPGTDGAVAVVDGRGTTTRIPLAAGTLTAPGGIAAGDDGELYVTNRSILAGAGEVVRLDLGR